MLKSCQNTSDFVMLKSCQFLSILAFILKVSKTHKNNKNNNNNNIFHLLRTALTTLLAVKKTEKTSNRALLLHSSIKRHFLQCVIALTQKFRMIASHYFHKQINKDTTVLEGRTHFQKYFRQFTFNTHIIIHGKLIVGIR